MAATGSSIAKKTVAAKHANLLLIITSTGDEFSGGININDFELH